MGKTVSQLGALDEFHCALSLSIRSMLLLVSNLSWFEHKNAEQVTEIGHRHKPLRKTRQRKTVAGVARMNPG